MQKRVFTVCLCVLLILYCFWSSADECEHNWQEAAGKPVTIIEKYDTISHKHVTYVTYACTKCGKTEMRESEYVLPRYEEHKLTYIEDLGHGAQMQHHYLYRCTKCDYYEIVTEFCSGPPCNANNNWIPVTPGEDE